MPRRDLLDFLFFISLWLSYSNQFLMDKSFLRFGPFVLLQITDGGQGVLADGLVISSQTICILVFTVLVFLLHLVLLLCHLFDDIGDDDDIPSAI